MSLGVYAAAGAVLLVLLRCALAQKRGVRCFLAGSVCGLGVPGVAAVLVLRVILRV